MENVNEKISVASTSKRVGGFLIDFGITFILYFIVLYNFGANVLTTSFGAKKDLNDYFAYATDSKLFEYTDNDKSSIQVVGTNQLAKNSDNNVYEAYKNDYYPAIKYFYSDFLVNDSRVNNREEAGIKYLYTKVFNLPSFESVNGLNIKTTDKEIYGDSKYYRYAVNSDGNVDTSLDIVLQDNYQNIIDGDDAEKKTNLINELNNYFYNASSNDSIFHKANEALINQQYYIDISNHSRLANWGIRAICYLPISFVIFSLIPLLRKNGESIGKLILNTAVTNKDGYQVKMKNKIYRSIFMFVFTSVCVLAPINSLYLFFAFVILCFINYGIMAISKNNEYHQALEDKIAKTIVIDKKKSQIYKNVEEENNFIKKTKIDNSKVEKNDIDYDSIMKEREKIYGKTNTNIKDVEFEEKKDN